MRLAGQALSDGSKTSGEANESINRALENPKEDLTDLVNPDSGYHGTDNTLGFGAQNYLG